MPVAASTFFAAFEAVLVADGALKEVRLLRRAVIEGMRAALVCSLAPPAKNVAFPVTPCGCREAQHNTAKLVLVYGCLIWQCM